MRHAMLLPQDVVVLAKLFSYGSGRPSLAQMAVELSLSPSQVHSAIKRLLVSRLVSDESRRNIPVRDSALEFLVHGLKYAFPAKRGEATRGIPTSYAAPPLSKFVVAGSELPPVWPYADGTVRGVSLEPLHRCVPAAASRDPKLYELLALADAIRDGRVRERQLAEREIVTRLRQSSDE